MKRQAFIILLLSVVASTAVQASESGKIIGWGGQIIGVDPMNGFIAIAAGDYHSLGLKQDGSIVAWEYNGSGQCDVPSPNTGFIAIAAGYQNSLGLK